MFEHLLQKHLKKCNAAKKIKPVKYDIRGGCTCTVLCLSSNVLHISWKTFCGVEILPHEILSMGIVVAMLASLY